MYEIFYGILPELGKTLWLKKDNLLVNHCISVSATEYWSEFIIIIKNRISVHLIAVGP